MSIDMTDDFQQWTVDESHSMLLPQQLNIKSQMDFITEQPKMYINKSPFRKPLKQSDADSNLSKQLLDTPQFQNRQFISLIDSLAHSSQVLAEANSAKDRNRAQ